MSLIHKALKKAERQEMPDAGAIITPEEEVVAAASKGGFLTASITPRTLVLVLLTLIAVLFAVYMNFCAEKRSKKVAEEALPEVQGPAQPSPVVVEENVVVADVSGISRMKEGGGGDISQEVMSLMGEGEKDFMSGDLDAALAKFTEALTKVPNFPKILNSIGLVFKKKGIPDEAEKYYNQALKTDPDCVECLNNMAVLKADKGDNVSAVLYLRKAMSLDETYADPYFNLAVIMEKEGNYRSAVENYKSFLSYTSSNDFGLKAKIKGRIEELVLNWEE